MSINKYKVIVIGNSNVGKTSLSYRFVEGKFPQATEVTIGMDFRQRKVNINDTDYILELWDTAGLEQNRKSMVTHYYRNAHAVVLVYDITNLNSFKSLSNWIQEIDLHANSNPLKILVGNKCDEKAVVSTNMAQKFADQHDMVLFETSAKLDSEYDNVEAIFLTLAHKLVNSRQFIPQQRNIKLAQSSEKPASSSYCCYFF